MKKIVILIMTFLLASVLAIARFSYIRRHDHIRYHQTRENLGNDVNRNLPVGSEKPLVLQFLKEHSISYYDFDPKSAFGKGTAITDPWYASTAESVKGATDWIGICRIEIEFKFDKNNRLLGYRDKPTCKDALF
jgi:hypothetical protein